MSYKKQRSVTATISKNLFLVLGMTSNCANTISNMDKGRQDIPFQFMKVEKGSSKLLNKQTSSFQKKYVFKN